jgi:hypothetical protein
MAELKGIVISIRINEEEKELLTQEGEKLGMSLSQYVRYKALDEDNAKVDRSKCTTEFLEKHMAKLSRILIDGYFNIKALTHKELSDEERDEVLELSHKEFDTMGIVKWKERYGEKTIKTNDQDNEDEEKG